jgi:hypothetical protein
MCARAASETKNPAMHDDDMDDVCTFNIDPVPLHNIFELE